MANPIDSFENLRSRVERLLKVSAPRSLEREQLALSLSGVSREDLALALPTRNLASFLDFLLDAVPTGDVFLFGGVLRDLALFGRKGFKSDIDLVVEGGWDNCISYLDSLGARKNKFGGYRLDVAGWPVDIWNAEETWAIKQGLVKYSGVHSLTETTILNWDAILMNWRTRNFIYRERYLEELMKRRLDIVLEENPNPLGMAVRVFRHLCGKDAKSITMKVANYLGECTDRYSFEVLRGAEMKSYGDSLIEPAIYMLFERFRNADNLNKRVKFLTASESLKKEGIALSNRQFEWNF